MDAVSLRSDDEMVFLVLVTGFFQTGKNQPIHNSAYFCEMFGFAGSHNLPPPPLQTSYFPGWP